MTTEKTPNVSAGEILEYREKYTRPVYNGLVFALKGTLEEHHKEQIALFDAVSVAAYRGKLAGALARGVTRSWYHENKEDCLSIASLAVSESLPRFVRMIRLDVKLNGVSLDAIDALFGSLRSHAMQALGRAEYQTHRKADKVVPAWVVKSCGYDKSERIPVALTSLYTWDDVQEHALALCPSDSIRSACLMLLNDVEFPNLSHNKPLRTARAKAIECIKTAANDLWDIAL